MDGFEARSPPMSIGFRTEFSDRAALDVAVIELYNMTPESENLIRRNERIALSSGYEQDHGLVMEGFVSNVHAYYDRVDRICEVEMLDGVPALLETIEEDLTGQRAIDVMERLLDYAGIEVGAMELPDDVTLERYEANDSIITVLGHLADECGGKFYITDGIAYAVPHDYSVERTIAINADTGLIGLPTRIDSDDGRIWEIRTLLDHRIRTGMRVEVSSGTADGVFRVVRGEHRSGGGDHTTRIEVADI